MRCRMDEDFLLKLIEKQQKRDDRKFYALCFLFLVFMLFAYLYPVVSDIDTTQTVTGKDNVTVTNEVK